MSMKGIRRWVIGVPTAVLVFLQWLQYAAITAGAPPQVLHTVAAVVMVIGVVVFSLIILHILQRTHDRLERAVQEANEKNTLLQALHEASLSITAELNLDVVLQRVVELSRKVVGSEYGALGVLDDRGKIHRFITSGIDPHKRALMGDPPTGKGVLGVVIQERSALRLDDIQAHPRSVGFPPHHPHMKTFLGVPIVYQDQVFGNLYLTDKEGGQPFTAADQDAVERLAAQAAIAIANARLYERVDRLSAVEERERIAMDLHDGVIQSLYAIGLAIDDCGEQVEENPSGVRAKLDELVDRVNGVIQDIRHYIFDLRKPTPEGRRLGELIDSVVGSLRVGEVPKVERHGTAEAVRVGPEEAIEVCHIVREAVSNAMKHAQANQITIRTGEHQRRLQIAVLDDGVGFDPQQAVGDGHLGLSTMAARAAALGGRLQVESKPGEGTEIFLECPLDGKEMAS